MTSIEQQIDTWARAELASDTGTLRDVLHPAFVGVGPYGFVLDRDQWLQRFAGGLAYESLTFTPDMSPRLVDGCVFVIGTQQQAGTHQGRRIDGSFRVTLTFTDEPEALLVGAHLSLRTTPGSLS